MKSVALLGLLLSACGPGVMPDAGSDDGSIHSDGSNSGDARGVAQQTGALDLLFMIDNSNSMANPQSHFLAQLGQFFASLTQPLCTSSTTPTAHTCVAGDPTDRPISTAVTDMHVAVISSDLGTPNASIPGCSAANTGDDGLINPIRYGPATMTHEPATAAPSGFGRPTDCIDINQFPSFLTYNSQNGSATGFTHDAQCSAGLYLAGCGLESQLEAIWRALLWHDASDFPSNTGPNAGFLREGAILAIIVLSDEEDGSVRNCPYARSALSDDLCTGDALDVYQPASPNWISTNVNSRFYLYTPGSPTDPTWPLERYISPTDANHGFLALKPGHPERVIFAAITGVPVNTDAQTNWDQLLGTVAQTNDPSDFISRDSQTAIHMDTAEGPISMIQANQDPNCVDRVVPACRAPGTPYDPTNCSTVPQYFAWPARRIVEVARRFDQSNLCPGGACHNGLVSSICAADFGPAMQRILTTIQARL